MDSSDSGESYAGLSHLTGTTRHDASFDELCKGLKRTYCLDRLVSLLGNDNSSKSFHEAERTLCDHIKAILQEIELQSGRAIIKYTIGKTFARKRRSSRHRFMKFNPLNANTWKLDNGANQRWCEYRSQGYHGLVVLCAATAEEVPPSGIKITPQNYAFALEQRLIHHFVFAEKDERVGNISFASGGHAEDTKVKAGLVYVAYKFFEDTDKNADLRKDNPSTSKTKSGQNPTPINSCNLKEHLMSIGEESNRLENWVISSDFTSNNIVLDKDQQYLPGEYSQAGNQISQDQHDQPDECSQPENHIHSQPSECSQLKYKRSTNMPSPPKTNQGQVCSYVDRKCHSNSCSLPGSEITVLCDNNTCCSWFHKSCINDPDNPWFCEKCKESSTIANVSNMETIDEDKTSNTVMRGRVNRESSRQKDDDERRFPCDVCSKSFKQSAHLTIHKRTHTGDRPYECDTCGRRFTQSGHLKQHVRIHNGEKPYACEKCGKTFRQTAHKKNHTCLR